MGRSRWTPRSPARISTRRTSPASQGDGSNYRNLHEEPADHGIGRSRGGLSTKIHQLVDGTGLPLVSLITPAKPGTPRCCCRCWGGCAWHGPVGRPRTRPEAVLGDKAYSSRAIRTHLRARGIKAVIPEPADQQGHRRRRGSAGGRPWAWTRRLTRAGT
ncbi:transposase [Micrococcus luteus]|uniref:transposase n=1 Tax=Micrococcus luteus TaxID=1270 RepID=UPI0035286F07